ncbi:MAG: ABC transporter ATP-binding protein [Actinobacteria bacterium]|nr:ABC transporter ATP-binding protein [Actinomycetota bacterium]
MPTIAPQRTREDVAATVQDLDVRRGGKPVLRGISLTISRGAVTGLLGPSGSGKTTLIRALVGVQVVHGGDVTVLGRPAGAPELRRRVAYVTQAPSIYADLTVRENLTYFARVLAVPAARIEEVVATVDLRDELDRVAATLSGGERSRASLAVALLGEPELLVLDEPTVGLDPVLRQGLWETFHALAARGVTLLVSTHVMDEASRCHELVLLREGRIVASGPPDQLLRETGSDDLEQAFIELARRA